MDGKRMGIQNQCREDEELERQYTQRVENPRTAQRIQSIVEEDMLLKGRPLAGSERASVREGVSRGQTEDLSSGTIGNQPGKRWSLQTQSTVHTNQPQERQVQLLPETGARPEADSEGPSGGAPASEEQLGPPPWSPPARNGEQQVEASEVLPASYASRCLIM